MPKFPIIGLAVIVLSLAAGFAGKMVWDLYEDLLLAAGLCFVGLMGILAGGMMMRWGTDRR